VVCEAKALAQNNSITISKASSDNPGEIVGEGSYTLKSKWVVNIIHLNVKKDGKELYNQTSFDSAKMTWKGLIIGLEEDATYEVYGSLLAEDEDTGLLTELKFSTTINVKVKKSI
jgi:hypothetical protein